MTGYKGKFEVKWWAWYLIDLRNWHRPIIVRKHFQTKAIALDYRKTWMTSDYQVLRGHEAEDMGLTNKLRIIKKIRHHTRSASKYHFPDSCVTQEQKQLFRLRQRRKINRMKRLPELTYKDLIFLLERNPTRFCIRTKIWRNWKYSHAIPTSNLHWYQKFYKWPQEVHICTVIEKTLIHYNYDIGIWPMEQVVRMIYMEYGTVINKFQRGVAKSEYWAKKELEARGFTTNRMIPTGERCIIKSRDGLSWKLWYPKYFRLGNPTNYPELDYVYESLPKIGIEGYTGCELSKKYKG